MGRVDLILSDSIKSFNSSKVLVLWASMYPSSRGRGAMGSRGQLTPTFSGVESTYGAWPFTCCRVH